VAMSAEPLLYSFRRCPYAMRARLALAVAGVSYQLCEVSLRSKPEALLRASPKGTVPVLVLADGTVIEQSLDIMYWALTQNDPEGWLAPGDAMKALIDENDGPFKRNLDTYKYANRFPADEGDRARAAGVTFLEQLEQRLSSNVYLFGSARSLADMALFPFVRQFARHDAPWFASLPLPRVQTWLSQHCESALFERVMTASTQA
jgi:glutathione S-transferase